MRVQITIDSASVAELRHLVLAHYRATGETGRVTVGLNGPECFTARTPMVRGDAGPRMLAAAARELVACHDAIAAARDA